VRWGKRCSHQLREEEGRERKRLIREYKLWGMGYAASVSVKVSGFQDVSFRISGCRFQVSSIRSQVSGLRSHVSVIRISYVSVHITLHLILNMNK
jgi:hypothetical protein